MGPSVSVRFQGVRVSVRLATPAILAVVAGGLVSASAPEGAPVALEAALLFLVAAAAILIHEAVRTVVYRVIGVRVRAVDLTVAGGSPALLDRTVTPRREVVAGLAGFAAITLLASSALLGNQLAQPGPDLQHLVHLATVALVALATLQAMPALPLDGGRILRAIVWYLTDDPAAGSRGAAIYGQVVSLALIGGGVALLLGEREQPYWGLAAITAGLQLSGAAFGESRDARRQRETDRIAIGQAGLPIPRRMAAGTPVDAAVDLLIDEGGRAAILIADDTGAPIGVVRLTDLRRIRRADWDRRTLAEIMTPLADLLTLPPETTLFAALDRLEGSGQDFAIVTTAEHQTLPVTHAELLAHIASRERTAAEPPLRPTQSP